MKRAQSALLIIFLTLFLVLNDPGNGMAVDDLLTESAAGESFLEYYDVGFAYIETELTSSAPAKSYVWPSFDIMHIVAISKVESSYYVVSTFPSNDLSLSYVLIGYCFGQAYKNRMVREECDQSAISPESVIWFWG